MIDITSGELILHQEDFQLSGIIPISVTRNYFTSINRPTMMGKHWHLNLEQYITIDEEGAYFQWQNCSGNLVEIPFIPIDDEAVIAEIKIIYHHYADHIHIYNYEKDLHYHFQKQQGGVRTIYRLTKTYRHRFEIHYQYTDTGRLRNIIDTHQKEIQFGYTDEGLLSNIKVYHPQTEQTHTKVRYEYDEEGRLHKVWDALEQAETYHYDDNDLLIEKIDRNGNGQYWKHQPAKEIPQCVARWNTHKKNYEAYTYEKAKRSSKTV